MSGRCETCRFHDDKYCRRYPPKFRISLIAYGVGWSSSRFPEVKDDDYCGEHRPKED